MPDTAFLYFSFIAGLAAFFAPCSFAILPGYIAYYVSQYSKDYKKSRLIRNLLQGFIFGLIASLGFFTIFGLAGLGVIAIGQFVKQLIPWIAVITGAILVVVGILMLFGRNFLFFQAPKINFAGRNKKFGVYLFGIAYAVGSLGCVFPIFLSIVIQGIASGSFIDGAYTILAYVLAMSFVMVSITALTFATKSIILKKIETLMPYMHKLSAIIIVAAGIYMVYYQYWLFI